LGQSLLLTLPLHMIVWQKRVAAFVLIPPQPEECRSALTRLAPRKSALVNVDE
jgi:hypothetical protein